MEKITFQEFSNIYQVKRNPVEHVSPYGNTMLDFGEAELNFLEEYTREKIWSLLDNDRDLVIYPGLQYKNVIGYFITKKAWIDNTKYVLK